MSSSPQSSSSSFSTGDHDHDHDQDYNNMNVMDDDFWSEVFSGENDDDHNNGGLNEFSDHGLISTATANLDYDQDMEFWLNVFTRSGDLPELLL